MKLKESPEDFVVTEVPIDFMGGDYLIVKVTKRELNTEDVAQLFVKRFGVPRKNVGYAGAKDRNAVTTQYFSLYGVDEEKVTSFSHEHIQVEVEGSHNAPLSLGDLEGNQFDIVVRDLRKPLVPQAKVRNYFGEQRFGRNNIKVGKLLVQKKFKEACIELDLPADNPVEELKKKPKHILLLYVHAYQSWLWNTILEHLDNPPELLPMVGFGTDFDEYGEEVRNQYEQLLGLEEVSSRDFIIKQLPGVSPEGTDRQTMVAVRELELGEYRDGVQKASFSLPKGSYATVVINALVQ